MALLHIPDQQRTIAAPEDIRAYLDGINIEFERWETSSLPAEATAAEILDIYSPQIERLKAQGGYRTADVIDVTPQTPNLDAMLARFSREHSHDEDEVRFIVEGRGLFHIHPAEGPVVAIEVEPGDLIRVPRGTKHWFDLCQSRRIRAIRLFQDVSGWSPIYTESGVDAGFQPICFGPADVRGEELARRLAQRD